MLLYILCHIFHCHAVVVCHSRYWCTFENSPEMPIESILDACDLHLVYLHPGIFGALQLKKCHGSLTSFSPPEFPDWSKNLPINNSDSSPTNSTAVDPTTENTVTMDYLDIMESTLANDKNLNVGVKGGNISPDSNGNTASNNTGSTQDHTPLQPILQLQRETPITLKECCCQVLISSCVLEHPSTLFFTCRNFISWQPGIAYNCSMVLPHHMNTPTYMMELLNHHPDRNFPQVTIKQV